MTTSSVVVLLLVCLHSVSSNVNSGNVTLIGCNLSDLKNKHLQDTTELYAVHCYIPELENAIFIRHSRLTLLEISDSMLSTLNDFALNGLTSLKSLNLARNKISEVKSWSDSDLTTVVSLDLRRNAIRQLYAESFRRFPNLQKLNLAVNQIDNIPSGVLHSMAHLKYVNIGKNFLKHIDFYTFRGLHKLSALALHCNRIEEINPQAFDTNNHLRSLRLESNKLTDLEFMAEMNLARLVHLNLSNNAIGSLKRLPFSKDYELRTLDVSFNQIDEISTDALSGLESLEMLNASHNRIHTIAAETFLELTSLTHLDISSNNLTRLPVGIFNSTRHLRSINMSHNSLEHLDSNHFEQMDHLQLLNLSINHLNRDNFIEGLLADHSPSSSSSSSLLLDLSNNMYTGLNLSALYEFARVDLSGNLWDCKWLIQEMIRGPSTIHFGRNYMVKDKEDVLSVPGVDCYDGQTRRSIVLLIADWNADPSAEAARGALSNGFWSKMRSNRFDDKEMVIWILIAVIVGFVFVRVVQAALVRSVFKNKSRDKDNRAEKEQDKLEMMYCADETMSAASMPLEGNNERGTKPKKLK